MKISSRERQFIIFGLGILLIALFYLLVLEPCLARAGQLKEKSQKSRELLVSMERKIAGKETLIDEAASLKREYLDVLASVKSLHEYLVEGKEPPDFSEQLQTIISERKLENLRTTFQSGKDFGVYKESKATLNFASDWHELCKFLHAAENSGHMLFVRSLRIRPYRRRKQKISVSNLEVSGFNFSPEIKKELKVEVEMPELMPGEESPAEEESSRTGFTRYEVIRKRDLFRKPATDEKKGPADAKKVTAAQLKLSLRGVISRGGEYVAIIRDLKTKEELFLEKGDLIKGDRIEGIFPDKVVIMHQGARVELVLHEVEGIPGLRAHPAREGEKPFPPPPGEGSLPPLPEKGMKRLAKSLQAELGTLVRGLDERMAERYGLPGGKGLLVLRVKRGSDAEKARVRRGDVILKINGREVNSEEEALGILAETDFEQDILVDVKRADQFKTLTIKSETVEEKLERMSGK